MGKIGLLSEIQKKLKTPKSQFNEFGKYRYRSCEDILEATKPLLKDAAIILDDQIVLVGDRYYVRATASLICEEGTFISTAYAREDVTKKGMDVAQITGASSSYARKYALSGLLLLDDTKDPDHTEGLLASNDPPFMIDGKTALEAQRAATKAPEEQSAKVKKALAWTIKQGMPELEIYKAVGPLDEIAEDDLPGLKAAYLAWKEKPTTDELPGSHHIYCERAGGEKVSLEHCRTTCQEYESYRDCPDYKK